MASFKGTYVADQEYSDSTSSSDISEQEFETDLESEEIQDEYSDEILSEIEDFDDDEEFNAMFFPKPCREVVGETSIKIESSDDDETFNNEDRLIAKLYREVVDDIMNINNMQESEMNKAIVIMKDKINQGHMTKFKLFDGIDFCKPSNCCGYLRLYAICHTGLVKKAIWRFLLQKELLCKFKIDTIFKTKELKMVSLGGGPGNDLVGFCSALNETNNFVEKLDLKIVDICQGWMSVFPSILQKANDADFGGFSKLLKKVEVTTSFMQADLKSDRVFKGKTLSSILVEANLVLMVKLASFMSDHEAEKLIQNVVDAMQDGAQLIFINQPFDKELFDKTSSLLPIYNYHQKYEMSFNPSKYHCPCIPSAQAHIGVFKKL